MLPFTKSKGGQCQRTLLRQGTEGIRRGKEGVFLARCGFEARRVASHFAQLTATMAPKKKTKSKAVADAGPAPDDSSVRSQPSLMVTSIPAAWLTLRLIG